MIEIGKVFSIKPNGMTTVRFDRKTACENCNMCLKPREVNYVELRLKNTIGAKVGDTVKVVMGKRAVLTASVIVYLIPLALMAIALVATHMLDQLISFGIGMGTLAIGFIIVAVIDKLIIRKKSDYLPRMVEIITTDTATGNKEIENE